jgi:drug/metabolite transporter (DMT)-like permease
VTVDTPGYNQTRPCSPCAPDTILAQALGVVAALAAATLYSCGVALQAIEAREAPPERGLKLSLVAGLLARPKWILGTLSVIGGWIMQAIALMEAPITIVQPALAVSVVVLLVISVRFFDQAVGRREIVAAAAIIVGVTGLALVAPPPNDGDANPLALAFGLTLLGLVALAPFLIKTNKQQFGTLVVLSAGLAYAWVGFSTKFLADGMSSGEGLAVVLVWLVASIAAGAIGLVSEMTALQTRSVIAVFPVVLVVQIVVAVLLAPLIAGEDFRTHPLVLFVLVVSLVVLAAGTRALAKCKAVRTLVAD